jgi:hypothetical protein
MKESGTPTGCGRTRRSSSAKTSGELGDGDSRVVKAARGSGSLRDRHSAVDPARGAARATWRRRWSKRMVERSWTLPGCWRCSTANNRDEWDDGDRRVVKEAGASGPHATRRTRPEGDEEMMTVEEHC